jgi:hypothetical protein
MKKVYCLTQDQIEEMLERQKFLCAESFINSPNIDKGYWNILSAPYAVIPEGKKKNGIVRFFEKYIYRKINLV